MTNDQTILAQACTWLSKIKSGHEYDAIAFSEWLGSDDKHLQAYNEVSDNWQLLSQISSAQASIVPLRNTQKVKAQQVNTQKVSSVNTIAL